MPVVPQRKRGWLGGSGTLNPQVFQLVPLSQKLAKPIWFTPWLSCPDKTCICRVAVDFARNVRMLIVFFVGRFSRLQRHPDFIGLFFKFFADFFIFYPFLFFPFNK